MISGRDMSQWCLIFVLRVFREFLLFASVMTLPLITTLPGCVK